MIRAAVTLVASLFLPLAGMAAPAAEVPVLFDGKTLAGWRESGFTDGGKVAVEAPFRDGPAAIVIQSGKYLSGLTWQDGGRLPRSGYELTLEAMRIEGGDFFCGLTFPVGPSACSLIVGGWGGGVVGISSIDHSDASENETTTARTFASGRWYRIRVRVTEAKLEAWIDDENVVDLELPGRRIMLRGGDIELAAPLGISTYQTKAAVREIRLRRV